MTDGIRFLDESGPNKIAVFVALFLGVVGHWAYEVAVGAIKNDGIWDWGNRGVVLARLFVSLIASVSVFVASYRQVSKADPGFRWVAAFVLGLGVDALTSPWAADAAP